MKNRFWFGFVLIFLIFAFSYPLNVTYAQGELAQQSVMGTIDRITDDGISLKTDEGKTREFTINKAENQGIKSKGLKQGDHIVLSFNQKNEVVDANKATDQPITQPPSVQPNPSLGTTTTQPPREQAIPRLGSPPTIQHPLGQPLPPGNSP